MYRDPEELRRRLEANPADEAAFSALRAVYAEGGHHEALAELLEYRATYGTHGAEAADLFFGAGEIWLDRLGDGSRGSAALGRALDEHPVHRRAADRLDAYYREAGDTPALVQLLERRIGALETHDPGAATAALRAHHHQQLGEIWEQSYGRQDQAITHFRRAFELDPSNVMALYCAREVYQKVGNFETAAKLLDLEARAESDQSRRVALYRELAHVRAERLGDLEGAVVSLKRALTIEPSSPDVMGELALMLLRRAPLGGGDDDRARAADLLYEIAASSSPETALGYCEAALDAWPEHEGALDLLEASCHAIGRADLLADRYRRVLEGLGESPTAWVVYRKAGTLALELGDLEEALSCFQALERLGDPEDREILEDLYRRTGRREELVASLASGLPRYDVSPEVADPAAVPRLRELVELLRAQGRDEEAEHRMREILAISPGDPEATSYLERRYRTRNDWAGLYKLLVEAGGSHELPAATRVVRLREAAGIAEERMRNPDGAISAYKLAVILAPDDEDLRRQLDRLLHAHNRWDDLVDRMETDAARAQTLEDKIEQLRRIGEMHSGRRNDLSAAAETYRRILELRPDDRGALEALDELLLRQGEWAALLEVLERRSAHTPIDAEKASLDLRIGSILHEQLERPDEAFEACRRALGHVPDKAPALARMEAIDTIGGNWPRLLETLRYKAEVSGGEERVAALTRAAVLAQERLEDPAQSAELWRQVVALAPEDPGTLSSLAAALERAGRWQDALQTLRRLAEVSTDAGEQLEARRRIARVLEEKGDAEEAREAWQEIADRVEDGEALTALASVFETEGSHDRLVDVLARLERLLEGESAARKDALLRQARTLAGPLRQAEEAVDVFERVLAEVDPRCREALEGLRQIHASRGEFELAAKAAERELALVEDAGARTELLLLCGTWYRSELRDLPKAIEAHEMALEVDPYRSDVIAALEELYVEVEDWERLLRLTRARYKASTDLVQCRELLRAGARICEEHLEDPERAWGWYRELFDRLGERPGMLAEIEAAAERMRLGPEIIEIYGELAKAAASDLDGARYWRKIGFVYDGWLGDHARALEAVLRSFALDPSDLDLLDTIDDLAVRTEAHGRLVKVYEALLDRERDPRQQVSLRKRLAAVMMRPGGKPEIAFDQLVEALETVPDDADLLHDIEAAAEASRRFEDLLDLYETHRDFTRNRKEKINLLLRSAHLIQKHLAAPDRAFALLGDALAIDPANHGLAERVDAVVESLEARAPAELRGVLWRKLVGLYREQARAREDDQLAQVQLLDRVATIEKERLGDGRAAFETSKQATLVVPGHGPALERLEELAGEFKLWPELAAHHAAALEAVLDRDAAVDLHRRRARLLTEELGRPEDAVEHYWQLIQIDPGDAETRGKLAAIYSQVGRWNDLMMLLERELSSADAARRRAILLEIARIWEDRLGNRYEAQDAYRRLLGELPDDPDAKAALERLSRPAPGSGSLDDDALAELGLLDGAEMPPPAYSAVPDDYLTAGRAEASGPPPIPPGPGGPPPVPGRTASEPPPLSDEVVTDPEGEPELHRGPGGAVLAPPASPDSTSEIDVSQVEEVLDKVDEALEEEIDLDELEAETPAPRTTRPPPLPASRPSRPPPVPRK